MQSYTVKFISFRKYPDDYRQKDGESSSDSSVPTGATTRNSSFIAAVCKGKNASVSMSVLFFILSAESWSERWC